MNDFSPEDLNMIMETMPDLGNSIFEICQINVRELNKVISSENYNEDTFMKDLTPERIEEMTLFYENLIPIFSDRELYEDCEMILTILDELKKFKEKVGSC